VIALVVSTVVSTVIGTVIGTVLVLCWCCGVHRVPRRS